MSAPAIITTNRPERMNAMDLEAYQQFSAAWQRARDDADIRVAIITGVGGRASSSGADLPSSVNAPADMSQSWRPHREQLLNRGLEVWKPIVAAVNGYCVGGGIRAGDDDRAAAVMTRHVHTYRELVETCDVPEDVPL